MRIKHYRILTGETEKRLEEQVNKLIVEGWQPFGPPAVVPPVEKDPRYLQAVVQYEGEIRG